MTRAGARWLLVCLGALCAACEGSRIPQADVPEAPIAIRYRTPEEARQYADAWEDARKARQERTGSARGPVDPDAPGTDGGEIRARADQVRDLFGTLLGIGAPEDVTEDRFPGRLALLDPRSGTVRVVAAARRASFPLDWSADHERLLFTQPDGRGLTEQIFEYDRERETVRPVTHGPTAHMRACYAAEDRIVVAAVLKEEGEFKSRIEVSRPGGRGPFEPVSDWGLNDYPSCSPDGSAVVWMQHAGRNRTDLLMRAPIESGETRSLARGAYPSFSPDGAWIVFSAKLRQGWRLWRMRPDGSGRAPIGSGARGELRASVSPDGQFVVYVASEEPPRAHLYLRRFDGSGDRVLFAEGDADFPVW